MNSNILGFQRADRPAVDDHPLHYTACGLDNVYLLNGFKRETIDGEEYVTVEDLDGLWKAIGLHLVTTRKALAPERDQVPASAHGDGAGRAGGTA
jgi:hypothetical protein